MHLRSPTGGMDRRGARDAERDSALRLARVVGDLLVADQPIRVVRRGVPRAEDPVSQLERADIDRTEEMAKRVVHDLSVANTCMGRRDVSSLRPTRGAQERDSRYHCRHAEVPVRSWRWIR